MGLILVGGSVPWPSANLQISNRTLGLRPAQVAPECKKCQSVFFLKNRNMDDVLANVCHRGALVWRFAIFRKDWNCRWEYKLAGERSCRPPTLSPSILPSNNSLYPCFPPIPYLMSSPQVSSLRVIFSVRDTRFWFRVACSQAPAPAVLLILCLRLHEFPRGLLWLVNFVEVCNRFTSNILVAHLPSCRRP